MDNGIEELAILKDIHIGVRDTNHPCCYFIVDTLNGSASQIISIEECVKLIKDTLCYKLEDLNNKPCIVNRKDNIILFVKMR